MQAVVTAVELLLLSRLHVWSTYNYLLNVTFNI